jgi:flagellar hook-basal body complex protein FliE
MAKDIAEGRSDDIHGTMIELSKASIETRLAVNVKDKIIDAFYEIWRMSV